jgi:predicted DsbA family dithiol-disulfide isomerase
MANARAGTPTDTSAGTRDALPALRVDIWSDVVCPWCYIGKRRFERAMAELEGELALEVRFRPYQLDPTASPGKSGPVFDAYVRKFGGPEQARALLDRVTATAAADGLDFRMDRALRANTLLAHRLLWWAEQPGAPVDQIELKERLLQAYFVDGLDVGLPETLADLAVELGADRDQVLGFLASDGGRAEVADELAEAADLGISAVPTFVVNGQWAIPGAQDTDTFVNVFRRLADKLRAEQSAVPADGPACDDDVCDV